MTDDPHTPGRALFPEYSSLPGMFAEEVRGLAEDVLDRRRPEKGWGLWSIREQVSHVAWIPYLLFLVHWRETLFGEDLPRDITLVQTGGADRMLDPNRFHAMDDLLAALEDGCALGREILEEETRVSLRGKVLHRTVPRDLVWATGERVRDYIEGLVMPAHPGGYWKDDEDPDLFHQTLECALRHFIWEAYVHLKTIQMHKRAEGLAPRVPVPEVGYIPRLVWE
ncbi:MAG: hypothetical protein ACE5IM_02240 [Nitrospinota bacterium]